MRDILPIAGGCTVGSLLFRGVDLFLLPGINVPRSIYAIDWVLTLMFVLGARYFIRFGREILGRGKRGSDRRVLVVGAGSAGLMIVREIRENPGLEMIEVGFIDDDRAKIGTRIVAEAAAKFGAERFVLVSTDKAVRPTNVMGATKRLAELVIHNVANREGSTVFVAVRFGNVLGSVGSVIPIFRRQLATTGKLTVTHAEASRYFMLIPEAAGLILQAGAMGEGGEVFVLDMGEPVKIVDLAKNLIRLSGKELGVDAEIVFTGLRPGEKLHEELIVEGEDVGGTSHPKVMKLIGNEMLPPSWSKQVDELIVCAITGSGCDVVKKLDSLVAGYKPMYEFHGGPENPKTGTFTELPQNRDSHEPFDPALPFPSPPSKSVH